MASEIPLCGMERPGPGSGAGLGDMRPALPLVSLEHPAMSPDVPPPKDFPVQTHNKKKYSQLLVMSSYLGPSQQIFNTHDFYCVLSEYWGSGLFFFFPKLSPRKEGTALFLEPSNPLPLRSTLSFALSGSTVVVPLLFAIEFMKSHHRKQAPNLHFVVLSSITD